MSDYRDKQIRHRRATDAARAHRARRIVEEEKRRQREADEEERRYYEDYHNRHRTDAEK